MTDGRTDGLGSPAFVLCTYTVSQKTIHLIFDHNFDTFRPIFKILSPIDSQRNCLRSVTWSFTSP